MRYSIVQIAGVVDFIAGTEPSFRGRNACIQPGERFACHQGGDNWVYLHVLSAQGEALNGRIHARAFSKVTPHGQEGWFDRAQLDLRVDHRAWNEIRRNGWKEPACALRLEGASLPSTRPMPAVRAPLPGQTSAPPWSQWLIALLAGLRPRWLRS